MHWRRPRPVRRRVVGAGDAWHGDWYVILIRTRALHRVPVHLASLAGGLPGSLRPKTFVCDWQEQRIWRAEEGLGPRELGRSALGMSALMSSAWIADVYATGCGVPDGTRCAWSA